MLRWNHVPWFFWSDELWRDELKLDFRCWIQSNKRSFIQLIHHESILTTSVVHQWRILWRKTAALRGRAALHLQKWIVWVFFRRSWGLESQLRMLLHDFTRRIRPFLVFCNVGFDTVSVYARRAPSSYKWDYAAPTNKWPSKLVISM